jgi:hypothetical protein
MTPWPWRSRAASGAPTAPRATQARRMSPTRCARTASRSTRASAPRTTPSSAGALDQTASCHPTLVRGEPVGTTHQARLGPRVCLAPDSFGPVRCAKCALSHEGTFRRPGKLCEDCNIKRPNYGRADDKKRLWCGACANSHPDAISIGHQSEKCEDCHNKRPHFGMPDERRARWCDGPGARRPPSRQPLHPDFSRWWA